MKSSVGANTVDTTSPVYIKPNGYPDPFYVYCDNNVTTGGWTVCIFEKSVVNHKNVC